MDVECQGYLSIDQFARLGLPESVFKGIDMNNSGIIEYTSFVAACMPVSSINIQSIFNELQTKNFKNSLYCLCEYSVTFTSIRNAYYLPLQR